MRKPFAGWWLTGIVAIALVAMVAAILVAGDAGEGSFHAAVRATARTSLALFVLAFTASSLRRLHASPATAWLLANRRYIGVSFAASHALHLATIVAIAARWPTRSIAEAPPLTLVPGASVYLFVVAMAATSSDRAVAWLGLRRWRALHKIGAYLIWIAFAEAYVPRALKEPAYVAPAAITLAALAVRVVAWMRRLSVPHVVPSLGASEDSRARGTASKGRLRPASGEGVSSEMDPPVRPLRGDERTRG